MNIRAEGRMLFAAALATGASLVFAAVGRAEPVTVLDLDRGSFRAFLGFKTPLLRSADGQVKPLLGPKQGTMKEEDRKPWPMAESARPPADWSAVEFDDSRWPRVRGPVAVNEWLGADIYAPGNPSEWNLVCVRGKFRVTDPRQVKGLRLRVSHRGGVVVYVNGAELTRAHMPAGKLDFDTPAEPYPPEAYIKPDGRRYGEGDDKPFAERMACRVRSLPATSAPDSIEVPAAMLRRGVNVVAVASHAALLSELAVGAAEGPVTWRGKLTPWPHAGVVEVRLTADGEDGLVPNAGPNPGVELWSCQPLESVLVSDFADPSDKPRPIQIVGARNGSFSGKVAISSAASIRGLKAAVSDLAAEGGARIPAAAILLRRAEPASPDNSWNVPQRFDRLLADWPDDIAPVKVSLRGEKVQPAPAAVVPVWVTVRVPPDAAPGSYRGTLTIRAETPAASITVPMEVKVHDWRIPDPKDFVTHHNIYQSPETVARYHNVPLWSEKHFELIGKSIEALHQVGNKVLVLNLTVQSPSMGNAESMVRWVRQPGGDPSGQAGCTHDFTIVDKYLDVYQRTAGKPATICLNVWGQVYQKGAKDVAPPPGVTVFDPETKALSTMPQPPHGTPESLEFWKPVLAGVRERLEKRGWFDVAAVCCLSYCWHPPAEMVDVYHGIWPDGKWLNCSHTNPTQYKGTSVSMPVPYSEWVWGCGSLYNPDASPPDKRMYPRAWRPGAGRIELGNPRFGVGIIHALRDSSTLSAYRLVTEAALQGNLRGLGRVGGDFWPLQLGGGGRYSPMCTAAAAVGPVNNVVSMTSPGPEGAVFNERLEMFREGVQVAEAIIFLQKALETRQADGELARLIEQLLDERARHYLRTRPGQPANWWAIESSPWLERDDRLFALAAQVAKAPARPAASGASR